MNEANETHAAVEPAPEAASDGGAGAAAPDHAPASPLSSPPVIETPLPPDEALRRLDRLAVAGKLPGFKASGDGRGFHVAVFAEPFDRRLEAHMRDGGGGRTIIETRVKMLLKTPFIYTVAIGLAIWPGVALTDALIPASWGWIPTWQWYLPLLILPLPFALRGMVKRSDQAAREHLSEQIQRIAQATDGTIRASEQTANASEPHADTTRPSPERK